jgi:hypothetical protein
MNEQWTSPTFEQISASGECTAYAGSQDFDEATVAQDRARLEQPAVDRS